MIAENNGNAVQVAIRVRPTNATGRSIRRGWNKAWNVVGKQIREKNIRKHVEGESFFHQPTTPFFVDTSTTKQLYDKWLQPMLRRCLSRDQNLTLFAYGGTRSGKTHSMHGGGPEEWGLIQYCAKHIVEAEVYTSDLRFSYLEVHNEEIRDLLVGHASLSSSSNPPPFSPHSDASLRDDSCQQVRISNLEQVLELLRFGNKQRANAATPVKSGTSISHAIVRFFISKGTKTTRVNLVDLVGSEKTLMSANDGKIMIRENGIHGDKSVATLAKIILDCSVTGQPANHVNYRSSRLTRMLRPDLQDENSIIAMLCCINPTKRDNTRCSLKFVERTKLARIPIVKQKSISDERMEHGRDTVRSLQAELKCTREGLVDIVEDMEQLHAKALQESNKASREVEYFKSLLQNKDEKNESPTETTMSTSHHLTIASRPYIARQPSMEYPPREVILRNEESETKTFADESSHLDSAPPDILNLTTRLEATEDFCEVLVADIKTARTALRHLVETSSEQCREHDDEIGVVVTADSGHSREIVLRSRNRLAGNALQVAVFFVAIGYYQLGLAATMFLGLTLAVER